MVPLEAMACGVPVVAADVGGHLDSIVDGVTGVHVPPRRPGEAARRIRRLLADTTRRTAMGFAGVDRARARYSWPRIAQETLAVYERATARSEVAA
jgi:glycosyltransferase involved in cell wall biosynthesis